MPRWQDIPLVNRHRAHEMRRHPTVAENLLWYAVHRNNLGVRFRRQHPIGPYIVDLYCPPARLIVEIDGPSHGNDEAEAYDAYRDDYLRAKGFRVHHVANRQVYTNLHAVVETIWELIHSEQTPPVSPR